MIFGNKSLKKQLERIDDNFEGMASRIRNFELELEKFKTQIISLRGLVNRKLGEDAGIEKETSKSIDGLDELRK